MCFSDLGFLEHVPSYRNMLKEAARNHDIPINLDGPVRAADINDLVSRLVSGYSDEYVLEA